MKRASRTVATAAATSVAMLAFVAVSCGGGADENDYDGNTDGGGETTSAAPAAWFDDATAAWAVDFVHDSGATPEKHLVETMGAGAALLDADGDGSLDLYFVQSGSVPASNAQGPSRAAEPPNRLFLGNGPGAAPRGPGGGGPRFRDATDASGDAAHRGYGLGAAAGDVDGDGDVDLHVTCFGADALLVNDGAARFADRGDAAGVADPRWTASSLLFDADADGDLDLYVTAYVEIDVEDPPWCGDRRDGWRSYCHPDHFEGLQDRFYRNRGDGTFDDSTVAAGLADSFGKGLGVLACDLEDDGDLDLYVANDSVENKLWRNAGDGTFLDDTLITGTGVNRHGATEAGMGVACGDPDGDGDLDLFVTNFDDESNTLYRQDGGGFFTDATVAFGLEAPSRLPVGFGTVMEDFDLDGDVDLAVANGHIIDNIHLYHDGKTWRQPAQLYENTGARFRAAPELAGDLGAEPFVGRGLYTGDLDGDGDPDLVLTQCGGPARLFRNTATRAGLVLRGAPGTRVRAGALLRQLGGASSYLGTSAPAAYLPVDLLPDSLLVTAPGGARREVEIPRSPARRTLDL